MTGRQAIAVAMGMLIAFMLAVPWVTKFFFAYGDWVLGIHHLCG